MNELKKMFEGVEVLVKQQHVDEEKVKEFIYSKLMSLGEYLEHGSDVKENFEIQLCGNEFQIIYPFGHLDMVDLLNLDTIFKEYGYRLKAIADTQSRNIEKGLILYFSEIEE